MTPTKIDAYEVLYSSNTFVPRISLLNSGNYVGQLIFEPNGSALPEDTMSGNQVNLYYHLDDYQNAIDLLRNEGSITLYYNGSGAENGIQTTTEAVG